MNIGIIGLGYVGLTLGIAAANCGIKTYGVEINEHIKECLKNKKAHFFEPGLNELIEKHSESMFYSVDEFPKDVSFDAFIITVGTPLLKGAKTPNFEYIKSALNMIKDVYTGKELIILRSTVSVGTTRNVVIPFLSEMSKKTEEEILVSMCPERTVEGKAIEELTGLPQIISGNNKCALEVARKVFQIITPHIVEMNSLEEAELVKLYCNTYRDMWFALGNAFCLAAQEFNVNGIEVIEAANKGYARSNIPLPGFVAGPCLEKDAYILTNNMKDCASKDFILRARHLNESLEEQVVAWVEKMVGEGNQNKVIALSGMAFKGIPETSDLRGSSSVYIAQKLIKKGYTLQIHDFVANNEELLELGLGKVATSVEKVCENADVLLILNNHHKYKKVKLEKIIKDKNIKVLDVWNSCEINNKEYKNLYNLGNFNIEE